MDGPLRLLLKQCGVRLGAHCSKLHAWMNTVQATLAAMDQNEEAALVAAEQAAKELHREINRNLAESKTNVGAAFGLCFPTAFAPALIKRVTLLRALGLHSLIPSPYLLPTCLCPHLRVSCTALLLGAHVREPRCVFPRVCSSRRQHCLHFHLFSLLPLVAARVPLLL
jgi:hypothetical protein